MAYKQRWINFFKLLDGNKNGEIDKEDADFVVKRFFSSDKFTEEQQNKFRKAFRTWINGIIKAGGKGKLNLDEWLATVDKTLIGKSLAESPEWLTKGADFMFEAIDKNNNGLIGEGEFITLITGMVPSVPVEVARLAYRTIKGNFDKPTGREAAWSWFTGPDAMPQDIILSIAVFIV